MVDLNTTIPYSLYQPKLGMSTTKRFSCETFRLCATNSLIDNFLYISFVKVKKDMPSQNEI